MAREDAVLSICTSNYEEKVRVRQGPLLLKGVEGGIQRKGDDNDLSFD